MGHLKVLCCVTAGQMGMWRGPEKERLTALYWEYLMVVSMVFRKVPCSGHWTEAQMVLYFAKALPTEALMDC